MLVSPPNAPSPLRRYLGLGLTALALGLTGYAASVWTNSATTPVAVAAAPLDARAWILLERSLRVDAQMPVAARVQTVVFAGNRQIQSDAKLVRAPNHLTIAYLSGPMRGQAGGFSGRWFWRQNEGKLVPYAEVAQKPDEMARARFGLMRRNYSAQLQAPQVLNGRRVDVVELRPLHPAPGASGPARRVFIDAATGLTLRTETFNYRLQPVSHSTFSQLQLRPPLPETTFQSPAKIAEAARASFWQGEELGRNARAVESRIGLAPPRSQSLPQGFVADGVGVHRCEASVPGMQVAAFTRYTDGLNVLTIYAVKSVANLAAVTAPTPNGAAALEADLNCNFGPGTVISRAGDGGVLVAMGDLPVAVLRRALKDARFEAVAVATPAPVASATAGASVVKGANAVRGE